MGLVELPIYPMPNGDRLVVPRVLARTALVTRNVVAVPDGHVVSEMEDPARVTGIDPERAERAEQARRFWTEFADGCLKLDDPEQPKPKPARFNYISFSLPAPASWLTVYRTPQRGEVAIFLSSWRNTPGAYAMQAIVDEWKAGGAVRGELGGAVRPYRVAGDSLDSIIDSLQIGSLEQPEERKRAFSRLAERVNTFVRVLRPRMRSAAADYQEGE